MSMNKMDSAALYREHDKAVTAANRKLHDAGALVDVTVTVGDVAFSCHKSLLAAWSGFFRSMFSSDFTENRSSQVTLAETSMLSSEAFVLLHTWMYRGELNLTLDSAELLLPSAFYLQMDKTVDMLTDYIKIQYSGNVPVTRMFRHLNLAHSCGMPHLRDIALAGMARKFDDLVKAEEVFELNADDFLTLLGMDQLNATSEDVAFNAAFAWLHQSEDRLDYLRDVLESLRVGLVSTRTIRKALDVKIMSQDSECCDILLDTLAARDSHAESLQLLQQTFSGMFVERTGPLTPSSESDVSRNPCTLYGDIWRDAYANLGDSRPDMSDVTVVVDGEDFRCHKEILFGWSEYFARRFLVEEGHPDGDDCALGDSPKSDNEESVQPGDQPSSPRGALKSSGDTPNSHTDVRPCPTIDRFTTDKPGSRPGAEGATSDPDGSVARDADPETSPHRSPGGAMVGQWRDSSSHISLTGDYVTKNTVRVLLDWINRGQLKVTTKNLCDVMKCARCLQMDGVVEVVNKYFHSYGTTLAGGEIITMLHAAKKCDLADVSETCFNQIVANFEEVWVSPEFKELLDIETLLSLLQDDRLNVSSEDVALQAALSWLRHGDNRLGHIGDVIKLVRLGLVGAETFTDGLELAFLSRDMEAFASFSRLTMRDTREAVLRKDHPALFQRRQQGKAFYDHLAVTDRLGSTKSFWGDSETPGNPGAGYLENVRGACVLGELTLVADMTANRLVGFIRKKITSEYHYLCHVGIKSPCFCVTDPDTATVYVCSCDTDSVTMVKWTELKGLHVVGSLKARFRLCSPLHIAMATGDQEHVYVACKDGVHKVSVTTDTVVTRLGRPAGVSDTCMSRRVALVGSAIMVLYGEHDVKERTPVLYRDISSPGRVVKLAGLKAPFCLGADGDNFLVGDFGNKCVYVVTPSGETLTTVNIGGVAPLNISLYEDNMYVASFDQRCLLYILA